MKLSGYILSFYMVLLAVFPCCLVDECPDDKVEQVADHQSGDEDCGNCSLFFSCEGCAFTSSVTEPIYFNLISLPAKQVYTEFISPSIPDIHYEFWQPPKLS